MLSLFHRKSLDGFSWLNLIKLRGKDKQSDKTWDSDAALIQVQLTLLFNYQFKIIASVIKGFEGPLRFPDAFHIHIFYVSPCFYFRWRYKLKLRIARKCFHKYQRYLDVYTELYIYIYI